MLYRTWRARQAGGESQGQFRMKFPTLVGGHRLLEFFQKAPPFEASVIPYRTSWHGRGVGNCPGFEITAVR